ncbi:MAG: PAS domain-containing sensor histidine kinase [bacterium]|nr:PAS domain-containing sensor histidine kinase [bacterium]
MDNHALLFKRLMENTPESVFFKDLNSRFIAINTTCAAKFGLENPEEAIGKTDFDFFAIEHAQVALEDEHQIIATQQPIINKEEREVFNDENRTVAWASTSKYPLLDEDGTVIGTYGITRNITEKKAQYEEIQHLKNQMESILNAVPNMIFVKDEYGRFVLANEAAKNYLGSEFGDIIGKTDYELGVPEERADQYRNIEKEVIATQKTAFHPEEKTYRRDGTEFWHQTIKVPFTLGNGKPGVLSVTTDVSKRIQYEVELLDSLNVISKQNERLSNFAHIVSHNLRNHAGGISMLSSLIQVSESTEEKEELIGMLESASERLNETIADLNEIIDKQSKAEIDLKLLDFREVLDGVKEVLATEIKTHGVEFIEEIEPGLYFRYSPAYLDSILLNLCSNAIKYRHPDRAPEVHIKVWREQEKVHMQISDNGRGIDLEKHAASIFGMYKTFHGNENAKGIGLYITKNQIESLGGSILIESEPDSGTTFTIDFGKQHRNKMLTPV